MKRHPKLANLFEVFFEREFKVQEVNQREKDISYLALSNQVTSCLQRVKE
jgi:hypothetical protein